MIKSVYIKNSRADRGLQGGISAGISTSRRINKKLQHPQKTYTAVRHCLFQSWSEGPTANLTLPLKQRGIRESVQNLYSHFSSDQSRTHLRLTGEQQKGEELQSEPSLRADNQFSKDLSITLKFDHRNNSLKVPGAFRNAQQSPGQTHWCSDRGRTSLPAKKNHRRRTFI